MGQDRVAASLTACVVIAGAIGAAQAGAAPTGSPLADALWSMALAGTIALICTRVHPVAWLLLGVASTALALGEPVAVTLASLSLLIAAVATVVAGVHRLPGVGPAIGMLAANALLRLPAMGTTGVSALLVALVLCPLALITWRDLATDERRRLARWSRNGAIAVGASIAISGLVIVGARGSVAGGIDAAQRGAERARAGDVDSARDHLDQAADQMAAASGWLGSPLMLPARALPLVGQQVRALSIATHDAADLARAGRDAIAVVADGGFEVVDGAIDLDTVRNAIEPLEASVAALEKVQSSLTALDSPWLLQPIEARLDELRDDIERNLPSARRALAGARLADGFLGADRPRRYLVAFTTPAESRFMGGFVGHYARVVIDDGRIDIEASGHPVDFQGRRAAEGRVLVGLDEHVERHANYAPEVFMENITATPDAPRAAEVARQVHELSTGLAIDAVVIMDPFAIGALATLNAPLDLDGVGTLDQDGVVQFLLTDQYTLFPDELEQRAVLDELIDETLDALLDGDLNLGGMVQRLGPLVEQGRLQVVSFDEAESDFLLDVGLTRPFIRPGPYDLLAVRSANATPNKLDAYLERTIDYEVVVDPRDRSMHATTTITLANDAPRWLRGVVSGGWDVPARGTNRQYVSVYSEHQIESLTVNGEPVDPWRQTELGWNVASVFVEILRGDEAVIEMRWSGHYRDEVDELVISHQPTVIPDRVTARVITTEGDTLLEVEGMLTNEVRRRFSVR